MNGEERTELQKLCEAIRQAEANSKAAIAEMSARLSDHMVSGAERVDGLAGQITGLETTLPKLVETTIERVLSQKRDAADLAQFRMLKRWAMATFGVMVTAFWPLVARLLDGALP